MTDAPLSIPIDELMTVGSLASQRDEKAVLSDAPRIVGNADGAIKGPMTRRGRWRLQEF